MWEEKKELEKRVGMRVEKQSSRWKLAWLNLGRGNPKFGGRVNTMARKCKNRKN